MPLTIDSKILRRKTSPEEYAVYRAGLEWDLIDPIVIESREDVRSESRWRDRLQPYHHQVTNLISFCRRLPVTLLADDVGLGKTISAGLIVSELLVRSRVSKILIVCPKLLGPQWQEELRTKFDIESIIATGSALVRADPDDIGAVITTYQSARAHLEKIPHDRFEMLILDEAHKLRNLYGVEKPPQVALRFREVLEQRRFRYVLMLTATPIQNRLWDMYSLVDLLTVARGHENPFGSEGMFARRFIADDRAKARRLREEAREEFRSTVYGYMSRVRRGDANLYFPDRVVQMHRVDPTRDELKLIGTLAEPIQKLNRLAQISILQALTSSPDALRAQLNNMAANGTVPRELAREVDSIVSTMPLSAKLTGLKALISGLRKENPDGWRLLVFTTRRETQTTIEDFLGREGLTVGTINGSSGPKNQETIARFWAKPPKIRVIVSTEAGSEGVNLQVANVLVNFDLPWNPMIVEQRIGRIQRLASEHKSVAIFNIMLAGTFEEYIVGRLMEKLQLASHAIGDIESLLEASGVEDGESGRGGFEERIRELVIQALAGKDVESATKMAQESIEKAKEELERESEAIDTMLGSMDGAEYVGPRAPNLPPVERSMPADQFVLSAFRVLGAEVSERIPGVFQVEQGRRREFIRFDRNDGRPTRSILYAPGTPAFSRLVSQITSTGVFDVEDADVDSFARIRAVADAWISAFGAQTVGVAISTVDRRFDGEVLVRVRATVAHDSYDRLVPVRCEPESHVVQLGTDGLRGVAEPLEEPGSIGLSLERIAEAAAEDPAVSEFRRFYLERREEEIKLAGDDERRRKKLADEFTPQLSMTLVGCEGTLRRDVSVDATFHFEDGSEYMSSVRMRPSSGEVLSFPRMEPCILSGKVVPADCLEACSVSGQKALRHLLARSEESERFALPDRLIECAVTGKRVLPDECVRSDITGKLVLRSYLVKSDLSGSLAEEVHMGRCDFTGAAALVRELAISEVSSKLYRADQMASSGVSGITGHSSEFVTCQETLRPILECESEVCDVTGQRVRKGVLQSCSLSGKRVVPSEIDRVSTSGELVLKTLLETSSISGNKIRRESALKSATGDYCSVDEGRRCAWTGETVHPHDLVSCTLSGLNFRRSHVTPDERPALEVLVEMLDGLRRTGNVRELWPRIEQKLSEALGSGKCEVQAAMLSPDGVRVACVARVKTLMGLRTKIAGFVYDQYDGEVVGKIALRKPL
jgi:superfamily II DNA or RNA helicase